jgi:O-antigen/teichoic acid export membrane protein
MQASNPRKLTTNFVLLLGGEALSKVFSFLAFAHLARVLRPDAYGAIEFALAATLFFNLIVEGGLGLLGTREIAKDEQSLRGITFHVVIIRCFLAILAFLLLLLFVLVSNKSWQEKQLVTLYGLTLFGTPGLLQWVFQGLDRMQWVSVSSVVRWSLFAGCIFLFIHEPGQIWIVPLIELAAVGSVVALNFSLFRYLFGGFPRKFDISFAFSLFRQAIPIGLTQIMWGLKFYLPTIMLGLLIGGKEVGWFGAGHRIVIALHAFVWMYYFNIYPSISRCTQQTPGALDRMMAKSLQLTSWSAVFIGVSGSLFAEPLILFVYGSQYGETALCFKVLIWLVSLTLISGHYMYMLIAYNRQWLELSSSISGAVVSICLNLFLISHYGFLGAAWAVLCSETVIWGLNYHFVRRNINDIRFWKHLIKPLAAGAVMVSATQLMPSSNVWVMGTVSVAVYGIALLILQPNIVTDFRIVIFGNH